MFSLGPFVFALTVGLLAAAGAYFLIQTYLRRRAEAEAGIAHLASLRWRDFVYLTLECLRREGLVEASIERQPGDSDFDFVLARNGQRWLLACKHGTRYRLGEQSVRDLATAVRMQGAEGGIIATLGEADGFAGEIAKAHGIRLLDGRRLWSMVSDLIPAEVGQAIREHGRRRAQRLLALAGLGALVLAAGVYSLADGGSPADAIDAVRTQADSARPAARAQAATPALIPTGEAALPPRLSEDEALARREAAADRVARIEAVNSAAWSTRSTLIIALNRPLEAVEHDPVAAACEILVEYEELRYTRLQIEPPPDSDAPVRWRQCR